MLVIIKYMSTSSSKYAVIEHNISLNSQFIVHVRYIRKNH